MHMTQVTTAYCILKRWELEHGTQPLSLVLAKNLTRADFRRQNTGISRLIRDLFLGRLLPSMLPHSRLYFIQQKIRYSEIQPVVAT